MMLEARSQIFGKRAQACESRKLIRPISSADFLRALSASAVSHTAPEE